MTVQLLLGWTRKKEKTSQSRPAKEKSKVDHEGREHKIGLFFSWSRLRSLFLFSSSALYWVALQCGLMCKKFPP